MKKPVILKIKFSTISQNPPQDSSWLPPEPSLVSNSENLNETTLTLRFEEGQLFFEQGNRWIPLESENHLKSEQASITLELETNKQNDSFQQAFKQEVGGSGFKPLSKNLETTSQLAKTTDWDTDFSDLDSDDPLDFLRRGLKSISLFTSHES